MTALNEKQVRALVVGEKVYYKERYGSLIDTLFEATVLEIYEYFILLECKVPRFDIFFKTTFAFTDCASETSYRFYKHDEDICYDT